MKRFLIRRRVFEKVCFTCKLLRMYSYIYTTFMNEAKCMNPIQCYTSDFFLNCLCSIKTVYEDTGQDGYLTYFYLFVSIERNVGLMCC